MTDDDHGQLANVLHGSTSMILLSGYRCELYDELYADWLRVDRGTYADGATKRVESLWINAAADHGQRRLDLG